MSRVKSLTATQKKEFFTGYHKYLSECKNNEVIPILKNFTNELLRNNSLLSVFESKLLENQLEQFRKTDGDELWPKISKVKSDISRYQSPSFKSHLLNRLKTVKESIKIYNELIPFQDGDDLILAQSLIEEFEGTIGKQTYIKGNESIIIEKLVAEYPDFIKDLESISPDKTKEIFKMLITNNVEKYSEIMEDILEHNLTHKDIKAIAYRKNQLNKFYKLLNDDVYFDNCIDENDSFIRSKERIWQNFFEDNQWIFGYSLNYIFSTSLAEKKLEQVVSGFDFNSSGKRVDALMKTNGMISSLCFVELKTHKDILLKKVNTAYRADCWQVSDNLSGAISQVQKTVYKAIKKQETKIEIYEKNGDPTGENIYLVQPRAFLIIGNLNEFRVSSTGVNVEKYSSFELFRRNLNNLEIITFDELYERAKYIVENQL